MPTSWVNTSGLHTLPSSVYLLRQLWPYTALINSTKLIPVNNTGKALLNVAKYDHNKHADYLDIIHINNTQVKMHRMYDKNAAGFKEITVTVKINKPNTLRIIKQVRSYTTVETVRETKTINE